MARSRSGALAVAAGIMVSRVFGFVRVRVLAHYLGNSEPMGAFQAALRIPNLLQNLLGEGVLSASFIPVYSKLLAEGKHEEASQVARAVATLLFFVATIVTLVGVLFAGQVSDLLAPGFHGPVRDLTVTLVRIFFPGTALLVLSAWCLGVLNSHRRFFLSYASPVLWNGAIIAFAVAFGAGATDEGGRSSLAVRLAWGAVVGSALQLLVQVPTVWALLRSLRPSLAIGSDGVRRTVRAFGPVLVGRGSVQISAYLDLLLASYLGPTMVSAMSYAQTIFLLPVALFGMSISAAELPEMSSATGGVDEVAAHLRRRLDGGLRKVVFFVTPSAVAFVAIGQVVVAALFQTGRFGPRDTEIVWLILTGSAIALPANTQSRLLTSAFYALGDTVTPLRCGLVRVILSFVVGWAVALPLRTHYGYAPVWGAFGLTAAFAIAGWVEFELLRRTLAVKIQGVPLPLSLSIRCLLAALVAGAVAYGVDTRIALTPWWRALVVLPIFGTLYLALTALLGVAELRAWLRPRLRSQRKP